MLIATRQLTLRLPDGDVNVPVHVYAPRQGNGSWNSRFKIGWPIDPIEMEIAGEDAVQALELALKTIGAHLYSSDYHARGELVWLEPGKGYGFPVTSNLRDMLVGDDRKHF